MDYRFALFLYVALLKIVDGLLFLGVWLAIYALRFKSDLIPIFKSLPSFQMYLAGTLPLALCFIAVFHLLGAYRKDRIHFGFKCVKKLFESVLVTVLCFISLSYFLKTHNYSRIYLLLFTVAIFFILVFERFIFQFFWQYLLDHAIKPLRLLLIGQGDLLELFVKNIEKHKPYPVQWIGRLGETGFSSVEYLGHESKLSYFINQADQVIVSYPSNHTQYKEVLLELSKYIIPVKLLPDYGKYHTFSYTADNEWGVPLLNFNQPPVSYSSRMTKQMLDYMLSFIMLLFLSPLMGLIAILIKLTSKGPVLYEQTRVGLDGQKITIYKFRSMRVDAEKETGPIWATQSDSRVTPLGKWLRRFSLDELPQLFNVLKGEMSLVGPRPERPVFVEQFRKTIPQYIHRHKMKSGCTGWAQVNDLRGHSSLEERIKYDLYYIEHWSHLFDLKILCLTFYKVLRSKHAY